jgi:formyltetrahydrofolate deformylase
MEKTKYILSLCCVDDYGIVASVCSFLTEHEAFIIESSQFSETLAKKFFMRIVFEMPPSKHTNLIKDFDKIAKRFSMQWSIQDLLYKPRVLVMVSKAGHCLNDILHKTHSNILNITIPAIVSNHKTLEHLATWYDIPFHYLPISQETKASQEEALLKLIEKESIDLIVLARYMQVFSERLCSLLYGKVINIHHSFLPSFKGAKPYHQAYERGVKIIGATAHYATQDLDEGPIIEQETIRVNHSHDPEKLVTLGQNVEASVLTSAIQLYAEKRVMINGNKTVVFKP